MLTQFFIILLLSEDVQAKCINAKMLFFPVQLILSLQICHLVNIVSAACYISVNVALKDEAEEEALYLNLDC